MEDSVTNQLVQEMTVTLEPLGSLTVIIVLKTPVQTKGDLLSMLRVSSPKITREIHLKSGEVKRKSDYHEVLLCGKLQNPIVKCLKSLHDENTGNTIIPIAVKKKTAV